MPLQADGATGAGVRPPGRQGRARIGRGRRVQGRGCRRPSWCRRSTRLCSWSCRQTSCRPTWCRQTWCRQTSCRRMLFHQRSFHRWSNRRNRNDRNCNSGCVSRCSHPSPRSSRSRMCCPRSLRPAPSEMRRSRRQSKLSFWSSLTSRFPLLVVCLLSQGHTQKLCQSRKCVGFVVNRRLGC